MHATSLALLMAAVPLALGAPADKRQESAEECVVEWVTVDPVGDAYTSDRDVATSTALAQPSTTASPVEPGSGDDDVKGQFSASTTFLFNGAMPSGISSSQEGDSITGGGPIPAVWSQNNIQFEDDYMLLTVRGGPAQPQEISSAQVETDFCVLYASVRTSAILTDEPGVCNGMFLYRHSDPSQETDIEWISNPESPQNIDAGNGTRSMLYTNWKNPAAAEASTSLYGAAPDDATSTVHEYRLDWHEDRVEWYLDGVFQHSLVDGERSDAYVPYAAGPWIWNNWANGDDGWTTTPPSNDAHFKIQKIEMYYNPAECPTGN